MENRARLASAPPFARFVEVARDPQACVQQLAAAGQRVIGLVCPNLPEELPHALGLLPARLVVRPRPPTRSPSVLQTFCCSWAQALLDQAMSGSLAHLAGVTFSGNTCDSLRNLPDIWRRSVERPGPEALHALRFPVVVDGRGARELLREELRAWAAWLEARAGRRLEATALQASAALFNRIRAALRRLKSSAEQGRLPYSLLQAAALGAQTLPRDEVADLLEQAAARAAEAPVEARFSERTRVLVVGAYLDEPRLFTFLEDHDAAVVDDEVCALSRVFDEASDLDPRDPLADLAQRHLRRSRCPVTLDSASSRGARLAQKAQRGSARGVILVPYKGCDPHAFDNVLLARTLDDLGIKHLTLEIEPHLGDWGQLTTRLEAFLEMIADEAGGNGVPVRRVGG